MDELPGSFPRRLTKECLRRSQKVLRPTIIILALGKMCFNSKAKVILGYDALHISTLDFKKVSYKIFHFAV